jgi:predicted Zn-dependent protease
MRAYSRWLVALVACLLLAAPVCAQKEKREALTEAQIEEIREAGVNPVARVNIYVKILDGLAAAIKSLAGRAHSAARSSRLDDALQDFIALMDELGSNLDVYAERKADIRRALKPLNEAAPRWLEMLRALPAEPSFYLARKEAIESGKDLADQAKLLLEAQTAYFKAHPGEQGQERAEPN